LIWRLVLQSSHFFAAVPADSENKLLKKWLKLTQNNFLTMFTKVQCCTKAQHPCVIVCDQIYVFNTQFFFRSMFVFLMLGVPVPRCLILNLIGNNVEQWFSTFFVSRYPYWLFQHFDVLLLKIGLKVIALWKLVTPTHSTSRDTKVCHGTPVWNLWRRVRGRKGEWEGGRESEASAQTEFALRRSRKNVISFSRNIWMRK